MKSWCNSCKKYRIDKKEWCTECNWEPVKVKDIMNRNPLVIAPTATIGDLKYLFKKFRYWSFFVSDSNNYLGIITRNDLKFRGKGLKLSTPVIKVMTRKPISIDENADITHAIFLLKTKKINTLAVVHDGKNSGIITRSDIDHHEKKIVHEKTENTKPNLKEKSLEAIYCSELIKEKLYHGDLFGAYKFALDLEQITEGEIKKMVLTLINQIESRIQNETNEVPTQLIQLAEL